jgi:Dephospho-CoA kinase
MLVIFLFSLSFFFFLVFLNFTTLLVSINQRRIKTKLGIEPILVYMLIYIVNMTVTKMVFKLSIWVVFFNTILLLASIFLARKIKIIGVTGGISCGKSTLCHFFEEFFKLPVVSADQVSRDIMRPGQPAYNEVLKIFGKDFLLPNGEFDRPKLGQVIFASKEKKRVLN